MPGGFKNFTAATAVSADVDNFLMLQSRMRFASVAARDSALSGVSAGDLEGAHCITLDTMTTWEHDGSSWSPWDSPPIAYTPTWDGLTPGNGDVDAWYKWQSGCLRLMGKITFGSTTSASGIIWQEIPFAMSANNIWQGGVSVLNQPAIPQIVALVIGIDVDKFAWIVAPANQPLSAPGYGYAVGDILTWDLTLVVA